MSHSTHIQVEGARVHNLKNLSVSIPKDKVVVVTGVSGSGESSLVFDTIHTEAQRQLIETFSSFARRRLPSLSRPDVDEIRGLATSIVIDQKSLGRTLRSTVGTATEIATYLRMLFSRFGKPFIGPSFFFSFNNPEGMCRECSGLGKRIRIRPELFYDPSKSLRQGALLVEPARSGFVADGLRRGGLRHHARMGDRDSRVGPYRRRLRLALAPPKS